MAPRTSVACDTEQTLKLISSKVYLAVHLFVPVPRPCRLVNTFPSSLFIAYQVTPQSQAGIPGPSGCQGQWQGPTALGLDLWPNDVVNVASEMFWHKLNKGRSTRHCSPALSSRMIGWGGWGAGAGARSGPVWCVCLPFCHTSGSKSSTPICLKCFEF